MAQDLTTMPDLDKPELMPWLYAHATLQRLLHPEDDGRDTFFGQIPGLKAIHAFPELQLTGWPGTALFLDNYLLEFADGWVDVFGGTKLHGWPQHVVAAIVPPLPGDFKFSSYWRFASQVNLASISAIIPPGDSRRIMFTGHSLGGASATAAAYFDFDRPVSRERSVVSFGAPKARTVTGMDGKDFVNLRVANELDPVPYLPLNPLPTNIFTALPKLSLYSYQHYGLGFHLSRISGSVWVRPDYFSVVGGILSALSDVAFGESAIACHYMESYVYRLRRELELNGWGFDPFWDKVNAYLNNVAGITWNIDSFPAANPPPVPSTVVIGAGGDWGSTEDEAATLYSAASANYLSPNPSVVVTPNQSLAAYMAGLNQRDIRDVTIHLSSEPVPDPTQVDLASFVEANFDGYSPLGGAEWVTSPPVNGAVPPRYARRLFFECLGSASPNVIHHWYAVAHVGPNDARELIQYGNFNQPIAMDKAKTVMMEINVLAANP